MNLGLGLSLDSLAGGGSGSEALLQTADYYWNASDWSGSGTWAPRVGAGAASLALATKVATGGTYNTDKTAERDLVWLSSAGSYITLPAEALPAMTDGASHTVAIVGKVYTVTSLQTMYTARDAAGAQAGVSFRFSSGAPDIISILDKGAVAISTPTTAEVTLNAWETFAMTLDPTNLNCWTGTRGDSGFRSVARGTFADVPSAPVHVIGRSQAALYPCPMAIEKIGIWKTSALTVEQLKLLNS